MGEDDLLAIHNAQHRHFSVTRYSLRSRRFWSTEAVIYASNIFQSVGLLLRPHVDASRLVPLRA